MKFRPILLIFLFLVSVSWLSSPTPVLAAGYVLNSVYCNADALTTATSVSCSGAACPSVGALVVITADGYGVNSAAATISESTLTYSWHTAVAVGTAAGYSHYIFYAIAPHSGCPIYTVDYHATSQTETMFVTWFSGNGTTGVLDDAASATFTSNSATQTSPAVTATGTDDLVISTVSCDSAATIEFSDGSGYTHPGSNWQSGVTSYRNEYQFMTSSGSKTATWGSLSGCLFTSGHYGVITIAAFKTPNVVGFATQIGATITGP